MSKKCKFGLPQLNLSTSSLTILEQETTFYQQVQKAHGLDLRDNRGKRHNLAFILLGVIVGLLRKRDGNLSSIHRSMVNTHEQLCSVLEIEQIKVVSRAQLPRILTKVNLDKFEAILFTHFAIKLDAEEKQWFAGDGKELRGSIEKGSKRGEALVQLVRHEDGAVLGQSGYNGKKESEKPCLRQLIKSQNAQHQKITADALHLNPSMTGLIEQAQGIFMIGLKGNQEELLSDMLWHVKKHKPLATHTTIDKGHGRLEQRYYSYFDVSNEYFDKRWKTSGLRSLFKVTRHRTILKTNESSKETSYYISNGKLTDQLEHAVEYFDAIRNHWSVEVINHVRDVSLKEDHFRTKKKLLQKQWLFYVP